MNLAGCKKLTLSPLTGYWFRALRLRHWDTRLQTGHSKTRSSRLSDASSPSYRMLYLGENHQVAIYEVGALLGDPNDPQSNPKGSWALMSIHVVLHRVVDLSDRAQQQLVATNSQELTGTWLNGPTPAPTQQLGAALYEIPRLEGFVYPSAKSKSRNLAVFMDKLGKRSKITFDNELADQQETLA